MKSEILRRGRFHSPCAGGASGARGAALVIVLSFLVLLLALVVLLLSRAGAERRGSSSFAAGTDARQLADFAVNIVQGQIHTATAGGITNAWASQPGMIRTYNSQGNLAAAYKLYSAGAMVAGSVSLTDDLPPSAWKAAPGVWTDLNDPVRLSYSFGGAGAANRALVYPILDPRASNAIGTVNPVAGFSISNVPGGSVAGTAAGPGSNPAPMPVRWLYVLQNGRLAVPSGQSGSVVSFSGADQPSATNPIVGRVAFWTDDESCKVNLNTAGEGTYWDTPRLTSTDDVRMAFYQPTRNEWQRYPGHPGTTSLSAVFPWANLPASANGTQFELVDPQARQAREAVRRATELSPVYRFGGSEAGTRAWLYPMGLATDDFFRASTNGRPLKRLYASVDELIFDDDFNASSPIRTSTNMLFQTGLSVARELVETRRFFLTAHSRAPETSLFNLPRIAIWPVFKLDGTNFNANRTTAFDRQIARCATINGRPYFFQREDSASASDIANTARNVELLEFLDQLTSRNVPGFGGAFSGKYAEQDRRQLLVSIYDYIRSANLFDEYLYAASPNRRTSTNTADQWAFTANFRTNAVQAFNFAPPGHGLVVPSVHNWGGQTYRGFGRFPSISEFGFHLIATADGSGGTTNAPINPPGVDAQTLDSWRRSNDPLRNRTLGGPSATPLGANEVSVQAMPVVELFDPMQGFTQVSLRGAVRISGLANLRINGQPLYATNSVTVNFGDTTSQLNQTFDYFAGSGFLGFRYFAASARTNLGGDSLAVSRTLRVPKGSPLAFSGGALTVEILAAPPASTVLQTINLQLPSADWPVPRLVTRPLGEAQASAIPQGRDAWQISPLLGLNLNVDPYPTFNIAGFSQQMPPERFWAFGNGQLDYNTDFVGGTGGTIEPRGGGRLNLLTAFGDSARRWHYMGIPSAQGSGAHILDGFDVVRTVHPSHGDFRLVNGQFEVPASMWTNAWSPANMLSHMLRESGSTGHVPGFRAQPGYANTAGMGNSGPSQFRYSDLPEAFNGGAGVATGDWDSGFSVAPDGPFINKPDEGNTFKGWDEGRAGYSGYLGFVPYFFRYALQYGGFATFSSPNRIMPSPGVFGSLPTMLKSGTPWQTLLFRPQAGHPGQASPADHLLMDLFWMPVVEPYALSEPFSTAGKVNLNYQILPFTYIERSTGLQAVLVNERLGAVPNGHAPRHKVSSIVNMDNNGPVDAADSTVRAVGSTRRPLNLAAVLRQFQSRFDRGEIFRSATEICSIHMVPAGENPAPGTEDAWAVGFWANNRLTGENIRERIYTTVYPRVTTKSNTFTVHVRAQALKQGGGVNPATWDESRGSVVGDYRGSTTLERYIDPNNPAIPDYAVNFATGAASLDSFYRWRVVQNRQFAP